MSLTALSAQHSHETGALYPVVSVWKPKSLFEIQGLNHFQLSYQQYKLKHVLKKSATKARCFTATLCCLLSLQTSTACGPSAPTPPAVTRFLSRSSDRPARGPRLAGVAAGAGSWARRWLLEHRAGRSPVTSTAAWQHW